MTVDRLLLEYMDWAASNSEYPGTVTLAEYVIGTVLPREIAKAKEGYDPDTEPYRCGTCRGCSPGGVTDNPFCWSCVEKSRHKEGAD